MHWIDPEHLPEVTGTVDRFLLNPKGEVDGLILVDGTEVHVPPHMGQDLLAAVRSGALVRVRGVRPRGADMIAAVSIAPEEGAAIVDRGPPDDKKTKQARKEHHDARAPMEAQGVVRRLLHGPKGEPRGILLEDGRSGRFPPHAADDLAALLVPDAQVFIRGEGLTTAHGTVIAVREIGTSADDARPVETGKPRPHDKHRDHDARQSEPPQAA